MTGVWEGFSDSSSDLSKEPEDAQTVEECRFNFHDLHNLHTARFVFRNIGLKRTDRWNVMILIMICEENKSKGMWWYKN